MDTELDNGIEPSPSQDNGSFRTDLEKALGDSEAAPGIESTPEPKQAPTQPPQQGATPASEAAPPMTPAVDAPPARLKDRFGTTWAALSPEVKQTFKEYETAIGRLGDRFGRAAQQWNQIREVTAPYDALIRSEPGGNLPGAIQNLFETARILRQGHPDQKVALTMAMLQRFSIPHERLPDGRLLLSPPSSDPRLLNHLSALEGQRLTAQSAHAQAVEQEVDDEIGQFRSDPSRPYTQIKGFMDTMAALIEQGRARDLASAYEQAAWLHPESREVEIAKRNQATLGQRSQEANVARAAAVSVPGNAPGALQRDSSKMSLRQELEARLAGDLI